MKRAARGRKQRAALAALIAAGALVLGGCTSAGDLSSDGGSSADGGFVIGVANGYIGNTWRAQYISEIETVADELKADGTISDLIVTNTTGDVSEQLSQLNDMLTRGVDAIMVNPVSSTALAPFIDKAQAQGVTVVINDNAAAYEGTYFIGYPQYDYWKIQAQWLAEELGGSGDIVEIGGVAGTTANDLRQQGADSILADYPGINVVGNTDGEWSETTAESAMSTFLAAHQNLSGVLVQDVMTEGVMRAFEKAGVSYVPTTGDYNFGFLRKWQANPDFDSIAVTNSPQIGADGVKFMVKLLQGYTFQDSALTENPLDPSLKNAYLVPYPYVITREGQPEAAWMDGISDVTKAISLEDALAGNESADDGESFGATISDEDVDAVMVAPK